VIAAESEIVYVLDRSNPRMKSGQQGERMFRSFVRGLAKQCGYEIMGHPRAYAACRTLSGLFQQEQINLVLDVGANEGQFADETRVAGYRGKIVSFEPLASAHAVLCSRAQADANWTIADRTALGAQTGSIEINIARNGVSSSILGMLPSHSEAEPGSKYVGTEVVPVNRLDDLCDLSSTDRVMLKIDVQGYEKQVLEGAPRVLANCKAVIVEMSLVPLYDGQLLAMDLWNLLAKQGFEAWSLEPGIRHPETGRMLQFDGIFVRSEDVSAA
jgi:FkbM family methyltransferase